MVVLVEIMVVSSHIQMIDSWMKGWKDLCCLWTLSENRPTVEKHHTHTRVQPKTVFD